MEYFVIGATAFFASFITFFCGFGLGTILLPVFILYFPIDLAIALTAAVHFLNNVYKVFLVGKKANKEIVMKFGIPAVTASLLGASTLLQLTGLGEIATYRLMEREFSVTAIKLAVSLLMIAFTLFEIIPTLRELSFNKKFLPLGGFLSGFLGGLSGHQGALRSAFLIRCNLSKEEFIASGAAIACLVDFARLFVYGNHFFYTDFSERAGILLFSIAAAFLGTYLANRIFKKTTFRSVQIIVSIMLFLIAFLLGLGLI